MSNYTEFFDRYNEQKQSRVIKGKAYDTTIADTVESYLKHNNIPQTADNIIKGYNALFTKWGKKASGHTGNYNKDTYDINNLLSSVFAQETLQQTPPQNSNPQDTKAQPENTQEVTPQNSNPQDTKAQPENINVNVIPDDIGNLSRTELKIMTSQGSISKIMAALMKNKRLKVGESPLKISYIQIAGTSGVYNDTEDRRFDQRYSYGRNVSGGNIR